MIDGGGVSLGPNKHFQTLKRPQGGGGAEGTLIFSSNVGSGPASTVHPPKKYQEFQAPQKIFEILATQKITPYSVP